MCEIKREQVQSAREWMADMSVQTEYGDFSLLDLHDKDRKRRMAEYWVKLLALEKLAREQGLVPVFLTLTARPEYHPSPAKGDNRWDGSLPENAARHLSGLWAELRLALFKLDIHPSGVRVTEPHKDGCPHGHALMFCHPSEKAAIKEAVDEIWDWSDSAAQVKFLDDLPPGQKPASAASYTMKYVMKSLGCEDPTALDSYATWTSTWAIRSASWFGLPTQKVWRALRSAKNCKFDSPDLALLVRQAQSGDYYSALKTMGGLGIKTKDRPFQFEVTEDGEIKVYEDGKVSCGTRTTIFMLFKLVEKALGEWHTG